MRKEFLLQAIGQIDDDLIADAEQSVKRPVLLRRQMGAWAAVLLVCVGVGSAFALWSTGLGGSAAAPESAFSEPMAPMAPMAPQVPSAPGLLADTVAPAEPVIPSAPMESVWPAEPGAAGSPVVPVKPTAPAAPDVSGTPGSAWNGPAITTQDGVYVLQLVQVVELPEDCLPLGTLLPAESDRAAYPVVSDPEYAGCPAWLSADGCVLYVQRADGRLLCGIPAE